MVHPALFACIAPALGASLLQLTSEISLKDTFWGTVDDKLSVQKKVCMGAAMGHCAAGFVLRNGVDMSMDRHQAWHQVGLSQSSYYTA